MKCWDTQKFYCSPYGVYLHLIHLDINTKQWKLNFTHRQKQIRFITFHVMFTYFSSCAYIRLWLLHAYSYAILYKGIYMRQENKIKEEKKENKWRSKGKKFSQEFCIVACAIGMDERHTHRHYTKYYMKENISLYPSTQEK